MDFWTDFLQKHPKYKPQHQFSSGDKVVYCGLLPIQKLDGLVGTVETTIPGMKQDGFGDRTIRPDVVRAYWVRYSIEGKPTMLHMWSHELEPYKQPSERS